MGILLNKSKNYIINGALDYWQRGTSFAAIANNAYNSDRFVYGKNGTIVHTLSQDTVVVPTLAESGFIFPASLRLALTTPLASLSAANYSLLNYRVEGQVFAPLAGKDFTFSFWVQATLAGTYSVSFRNGAQNRSFVSTYVINAANTWEKKSVTVLHDPSGTWDYATGLGLRIDVTLASGTTFQAPSLNVWNTGNFFSHASCVNGVAAGATNFRIAGIQLEEGTTASGFERAGGNVIIELTLSQRYFEKSYDLNVNPGTVTSLGTESNYFGGVNIGSNENGVSFNYKVMKRVAISAVAYSPYTGAIDRLGVQITSADVTTSNRTSQSKGFVNKGAGSGNTSGLEFHWTADAEL